LPPRSAETRRAGTGEHIDAMKAFVAQSGGAPPQIMSPPDHVRVR
jgi:hypothetical protein